MINLLHIPQNWCVAKSPHIFVKLYCTCSCLHLLFHSTALAVERAVDVQDQHLPQGIYHDKSCVACVCLTWCRLGKSRCWLLKTCAQRKRHYRNTCTRGRCKLEPRRAEHRQDTPSKISVTSTAGRLGAARQVEHKEPLLAPNTPAQRDLLLLQQRLVLLSVPVARGQERRRPY